MRSPAHHPDPNFATTLAHGLSLLQCFGVGSPRLSNKELAERSGLSKATVSRLTYTLMARGLLTYDGHLRRYQLGPTALSLGYPLLASLRVRQIARPLMKALADHAGGSVSLGIRDRTNMVYVETSRGHDALAFRPDIGASLPVMSSAMGRAWLAQAPLDECARLLDEISRTHPERHAANAKIAADARADLAGKGYCISRGEWQQDVHAIAVPMRTPVDGEILVFNCGVLTGRLKGDTIEGKLAPGLIDMVRQVETALFPPHL
ncbi:IclR family transcriptional regulator [Noviherbaspirillum sp. CPCC 100848]|uniref:IclR family transcriptional regulator n=1 Tax=Noviherbaspirillum album TaxID=3080276 RepID=A0ABU6JCA1_9BURK|nr:IclR family transcriptional regulator [Noviherbaspirillum sp. CPCC 100848]MEC4720955.1 IclR family transcriptional regulator [Noviherbaspirillum sp. CPCC 100848]